MSNKERFSAFCESTHVPIYSKPWWLDAICGPENWDVWLHENGDAIDAAMPYYLENRENGLYITKAPLTQNNGIIFRYPEGQKRVARAKFEERVVREAMAYADSLGLAVYEQQYPTTFTNWLPHSWCGCEALCRYTYCIEDTSNLDAVWAEVSSKQRAIVRKGQRNIDHIGSLDSDLFYQEHARIFSKQGLECPFSKALWQRLEEAARLNRSGKVFAAYGEGNELASLLYLVWDDNRAYHLLGGTMPGSTASDTYTALIWHAIEFAHEHGLAYDFEGSMIERISKSFREFGGVPQPYFRIRKVYSAEVVQAEAEAKVAKLKGNS